MKFLLVISLLLLGLFLRIYHLDLISSWGDEVASWYYSDNLLSVFSRETHTPTYYFLCKIWTIIFPHTILSLRYFSIVSSLLILSCSAFFLLRRKYGFESALFFFGLTWLWPSAIAYDRQARHYSLYASLTLLLLVIWDQRKIIRPSVIWIFFAFYISLHPLAIIPVFFLIFWGFYEERKISRMLTYLTSALPVVLYYCLRFFLQSYHGVVRDIGWIYNDTFFFLKSLFLMYAGDAYPFKVFFPIDRIVFAVFSLGFFLCFIPPKGRLKSYAGYLKQPLVLFVLTFIVVELVSLIGPNLRINRYYIYLVGFLLFGMTKLGAEEELSYKKTRMVLLVSGLLIYNLLVFKPWSFYEWDDQSLAQFRSDLNGPLKKKKVVICATAFQQKYYFGTELGYCWDKAREKRNLNEDYYVFDLNDSNASLIEELSPGTEADMRQYGRSKLFFIQHRNL